MSGLQRLGRVHIASNGFTSSLCRLQNGDLLVCFSSREADGWHVKLVRSTDSGRTWSEPRSLLRPVQGVGAAVHLGLAQLSDGSLLLPFVGNYSLSGMSGMSANLLRSADDGHTWSEPVKLAPNGEAPVELKWAGTYGRIRELSDGTVIVPGFGQAPGERLWRNMHFRSTDGGRTWSDVMTVSVGLDNEHDVIELPGQRLLAVHRDWRSPRYGHGVSPLWENYSDDLGRTWSRPEVTFQALYGHSPALFRTERGCLICGYRYTGDQDRGLCGVGFSLWNDDLSAWGFHQHVVNTPAVGEWRLGCGYPSWDYAGDDRLLCVYHTCPTYEASPLHAEQGLYTEIEGTFYAEQG